MDHNAVQRTWYLKLNDDFSHFMFKRRKFELFETFGVPKREGVTSYNRINCLNFQYFFNLCFFLDRGLNIEMYN